MQHDDRSTVSGIEFEDCAGAAVERGIEHWSDARLVRAVGCLVAEPRDAAPDSFLLHAPLELAARAALLTHVGAGARAAARCRVLEIAARYEAAGPGLGAAQAWVGPETPAAGLRGALAGGDVERADSAAQALGAASSPRELVAALADDLLPRTAAAAHAPILLYLLPRVAPRGELPGTLLRPLARRLAGAPEARLTWFEGLDLDRAADAAALERGLAELPAVPLAGDGFIHPTLMHAEAHGRLEERIGPALGRPDAPAMRSVLRLAAESMLLESADHAPYGWTHALTLPQAALGIARDCRRPARALAVAATCLAAFRLTLGCGPLAPERRAELRVRIGRDGPERRERLASAAGAHRDAHVAKYALACIDASNADRQARGLYLAAGERLLEVGSARE